MKGTGKIGVRLGACFWDSARKLLKCESTKNGIVAKLVVYIQRIKFEGHCIAYWALKV